MPSSDDLGLNLRRMHRLLSGNVIYPDVCIYRLSCIYPFSLNRFQLKLTGTRGVVPATVLEGQIQKIVLVRWVSDHDPDGLKASAPT